MYRLTCTHANCAQRDKTYGISTFMEHLACHNSEDNNGNEDAFAFRCGFPACNAKFVTRLHAEEHALHSEHTVYCSVSQITGRSFGGLEYAKILKIGEAQTVENGREPAIRQKTEHHQHKNVINYRCSPTHRRPPDHRSGAEFGYDNWSARDAQYVNRLRNNSGNEERKQHIQRTPGYYTPKTPGHSTPRALGYAEEQSGRVRLPQPPMIRRERRTPMDHPPAAMGNRLKLEVGDVEDVASSPYEYAGQKSSKPPAYDSRQPVPPPPPLHLRRKPDTHTIADVTPPKRTRHVRDSQGTSGIGAHSTGLYVTGNRSLEDEVFTPVPPPDASLVRMTNKNIPPPPFSSDVVRTNRGREEAAEMQAKVTKVKKPAYQFDPNPKRSVDNEVVVLDDEPLLPLPRYEDIFEQDGRDSDDDIILLDTESKIPKIKAEFGPVPPLRASSPRPKTPPRPLRPVPTTHRRESARRRPLRSPPPITRRSPDYGDDQKRSRRRSRSPRYSNRDGRRRSRSDSRDRDRARRDRRSAERAQAARKKAVEDWDAEVTHVSNENRCTFSRYGGQRPPKSLVKIGIVPEVPHRMPTPPKGSWESKLKTQERNKERSKEYARRNRDTKRKKKSIGDISESDDAEVAGPSRKRASDGRRPMTRSRSRSIQRVNYEESPFKEVSDKKPSKKRECSYSRSPRSASP